MRLMQRGDYASVGRNVISVVDLDRSGLDAYFEEDETSSIVKGTLRRSREGPRELIWRSRRPLLEATVANAQPDPAGLARSTRIFTWGGLPQRIPGGSNQASAGRRSPGYRIDGNRSVEPRIPRYSLMASGDTVRQNSRRPT